MTNTTTGDGSWRYCTEGGSPKSIKNPLDTMCSPSLDASKEEKEAFIKCLDNYIEKKKENNNTNTP